MENLDKYFNVALEAAKEAGKVRNFLILENLKLTAFCSNLCFVSI